MDEIIKIIKDPENQRHKNHINAGKKNWENIILKAKKKYLMILKN